MSDKDKNLDSDCDESDEDYVPEEKIGNVSEEEESGDAESDVEGCDDEPKSKRRKSGSKGKVDKDAADKAKPEKIEVDVDSIWADFKNDTQEPPKRTLPTPQTASIIPPKPTPLTPSPKPGGSTGGGLASLLNKIGKKDKISTLEKSRLDWNNFKRAEGIEEDLQKHNRGKAGFLEKRDFLERTDLRQYEIEKSLRKRSSR